MAKKQTHQDPGEGPSLKAVVKYARELRERAQTARIADPDARPYEITDKYARKLCAELGPQGALQEIARRVVLREHALREERMLANAGKGRLVVHQTITAAERDAHREQMSLGRRLDAALNGLAVVAEGPTQNFQPTIITGSKEKSRAPGFQEGAARRLHAEAVALVERVERECDQARRRMVETETAA